MARNNMLVDAFVQLAREKNIDKNDLNIIVEDVFKMILRKKYEEIDNFDVIVNLNIGTIEIFIEKEIVEEVEDPTTQIDLKTAKKSEPDLEVGDEFIELLDIEKTFGRRLIINARQALNQKIREIERQQLLDEFSHKVGEIVIGEIRQIYRQEIYVTFENTELILPKAEQIPSERYKRGQSLRVIIREVVDDPKGPRVIVSRSTPEFLRRLFELEVPEIYDGIIEIKAIARAPGERSKIAVVSNDKRIDAVGACVGMKGVRIQAIVKELNNEKIDIVNWDSDPETFIIRALSPATPLSLEIDEEDKYVTAVFTDDEIAIAVGRHGSNINLASEITGYDIDPLKQSDLEEYGEEEAESASVVSSDDAGEDEEEDSAQESIEAEDPVNEVETNKESDVQHTDSEQIEKMLQADGEKASQEGEPISNSTESDQVGEENGEATANLTPEVQEVEDGAESGEDEGTKK